MTTKDRGSTLPSYKFVYLSEIASKGLTATSAGSLTAADSWSLVPAGLAPYNPTPTTAVAPVNANITGQNANSGYAANGGDVNITPGTGSVGNKSGNVVIKDTAGNSGWNTAHLILGIYHIWVDTTGDMRIKNSAPTSDTDGTIIGTQS